MCYLGPRTPKICRKVLFPTFSSFGSKMIEQKLFLIRSQILGLLLNTLTANYELSRSSRDNLPLPIQSKLLKKRKSFWSIFFNFLDLHEIYNFLEKNEPHRLIISAVIDSGRWNLLNAYEGLFLNTFWK